MAGKDVDGLELSGTGVDDMQEAKGLLDAGSNFGVLVLQSRVADMAKSPVEGTVQISDTRGKR